MSEFAVQQEVALGLIQFHLSGFRAYPPSEAGEKVFARGLQECCVSVAHAEAVLKSFDQSFPTLKELFDTAHNLREKFLPPEEPLKQRWEREYGKPVHFDIDMEGICLCCNRPWSEILSAHAVDQEMWRRIKERLGCNDFSEVSWAKVYRAKQELGYRLSVQEQEQLNASS
jgi:hypothetical protein